MKQSTYGILIGKRVKRISDPIVWAKNFQDLSARRVAEDVVKAPVGFYVVSTVFLGLDHSFIPGARGVWFETMVFPYEKAPVKPIQERYHSWSEAKHGHDRIVNKLKGEFENGK